MLKQEKEQDLLEPQKPVVPAHVWTEIEELKLGRYVVLPVMPLPEWEEKVLNGFFRALEWLEYPVKIWVDEHTVLVFGSGLTWKEAGRMLENWKRT